MPLSKQELAARIYSLPPALIPQAVSLAEQIYGPAQQTKSNCLSKSQRLKYSADPVLWAEERLGIFLCSYQREILYSLRDNRRTAVPSCFESGKSFIAAVGICWWIDTHLPGEAKVVTTAPTGDQVKAILWQEIGRIHEKGSLAGRLNQTEWWLPVGKEGREELVAFGRKPKDTTESSESGRASFQGIHEKYVLVVPDEAAGISDSLLNQIEGLLGNEHARLLMIGNPEDRLSSFARECSPGSGTNVIHISAFRTPNFLDAVDEKGKSLYIGSREDEIVDRQCPQEVLDRLISPIWVEEKKRKWGETNPLYISKVLGEFPEHNTDGLIPISWIRAAQERSLSPDLPVELGVDVGGGGDKSVIALRQGPHVRVTHRDTNPDTMQTLSHVLAQIDYTGAGLAKMDYIGIGKGAADRAKEMAKDQAIRVQTPQLATRAGLVEGVNVGAPAQDRESFVNLRAEGYWSLRERFREGNIDIDSKDEDLAAQLVDLRYKRSSGRIQIESKQEMKKRGKRSPDDADAVMLAFIDPPRDPVQMIGAEWVR